MSGRIRLLAVISDLDGGGAERQLTLLLSQLSRQRFECHLCVWRPVFRYSLPADVRVHLVEKRRAWHLPRAVRGLRQLVDQLQPDLVFSQLHYVNMVTGTALAMARHRPRWICRQVNDPRREMRHVFALWARWALRRADCVVGCSQGVRREVIRHLRVAEARVVQLDNLADTRAIARQSLASLPIPRSPGTFTIVHAGRLHAQKNQFLLLDAFATLSGETELWMLGTGPLEARLRAYAQRLGITHRVRWFGFQDNPFPFFRQADCMALTSHFEGLPNVVIEAMVCGTPVVATRCPYGPDELIDHGETGLLVPTNDVAALANALRILQEQPGLRRRLGLTARSRATHRFDLERCGQAFERLFESVCRPSAEPTAVAG